ncbi:MAG: hypothetical protein NT169_22595 [Chloroflexi bacterium]|nr:hypothetical protein [Chloroflexota bacterium]
MHHIAEALAVRALKVLMRDAELIAWQRDELLPRAGFGHLDAAREYALIQARHQLAAVDSNAGFLRHERGASKAEVLAYLQRFSLRTEREARKMYAFLTAPLSSSYILTYHVGGKLVDALFAARGQPAHWFARLLTEPVTPNQVRAWTQAGTRSELP